MSAVRQRFFKSNWFTEIYLIFLIFAFNVHTNIAIRIMIFRYECFKSNFGDQI